MLDDNFNLKIIDFGLAVTLSPSDSEKMAKKIGTTGYQPPEMLVNQGYLCSDFDVFSSGVILFMMLIMSQPFESAHDKDPNYKAIMNEEWQRYWKVFISGNMNVS